MAVPKQDCNGEYHDDQGRYVSLRGYFEAILAEKEKQTEFARAQLERALVEAKSTTDRAMQEARSTIEGRLVEAKTAANEVIETLRSRLVILESGGAPFASRLDESLTELKLAVDVLKVNMVRTTVLDALREQTEGDIKAQRRAVIVAVLASGGALLIGLLQIVLRFSH